MENQEKSNIITFLDKKVDIDKLSNRTLKMIMKHHCYKLSAPGFSFYDDDSHHYDYSDHSW